MATMSTRFIIAGLASMASASIIPRMGEQECCFGISASGPVAGPLGQLGDGQNRVGGGYPPAQYCLKNGGLYDKQGRGCILTPPTTQWQCDEGAAPTYGFSIGPDNSARYNGSPEFWACPVNDYGEWNIYTVPVKDQKKCVPVHLSTSTQCAAPPPPPAAPPAPPKHEAPPAPKYEAPPPPPKYEAPPPPPKYEAPPPPPKYEAPPPPPKYEAPPPPPPKYEAPPPKPSTYAPPPPPPSSTPVYHPSSAASSSYYQPSTPPSSSAPSYKPSSTPVYQPSSTSEKAHYQSPSSSAGYAAPSSTGYACNPAHQYPEGQVCTEVNGSLTLMSATATPTSSFLICNAAAIARGDCTATAASVPTSSVA